MYLGRVTVYDDFNDNTAGGIPDAGRWLFPHAGPGDSCNFVQQEGRLKFIPGEGIGPDGCALRVAAPETSPGSELGSLSVQMRLLKRHEAGNLIVGLRVSSTFEDGDWNLDCSLVAGPDFTSFEMIVSDTRRGQVLYSAREDINPDEWYEVGLAVDGETMAVSCLLNGVEIGRSEPENPELLQTVPFFWEILVLDATAVSSEIWFDDFRVENGG
jgi:hypothetical protein